MSKLTEDDYTAYEKDMELLVDTLRKSFEADKAHYYVAEHQNILFIEIEGLDDFSQDEIIEIAEPVLDELDMDFNEISLVPLNH